LAALLCITSSVAFDLEECCRAMLMARRPAFPPLTSENDKVHFCLCHRFNLLLFVSGFFTVKKKAQHAHPQFRAADELIPSQSLTIYLRGRG
jgi:hypothetical protein